MTALIVCPAFSQLTEDDLITLSLVFPAPSRPSSCTKQSKRTL